MTYEAPEIIEEKQPAPKAEKPAPKPVKTEPKEEKPAVKPQKLSITDEDDTPRLVKAAPAVLFRKSSRSSVRAASAQTARAVNARPPAP